MPFTTEQFFAVFAAYNRAVWPAQLLFLAAAAALAVLVVRGGRRPARWMWGFLGALWIWTAAAYHLAHFRAVNPAAAAFGALFAVQGGLLLWRAVAPDLPVFRAGRDLRSAAGVGLIAYALAVYPLVGLLAGHAWLDGPTFGAPCPVVIYTFGVLLLAPTAPARLFAIPLAWAAVGSSAIVRFGVVQDVGMPVGAAAVLAALLLRRRRARPAPAAT